MFNAKLADSATNVEYSSRISLYTLRIDGIYLQNDIMAQIDCKMNIKIIDRT